MKTNIKCNNCHWIKRIDDKIYCLLPRCLKQLGSVNKKIDRRD
ncbi:hypothetical protein [Gottschalkia purinilytica]|nr:hypothetical protein [Gottschalkia purinilytica]